MSFDLIRIFLLGDVLGELGLTVKEIPVGREVSPYGCESHGEREEDELEEDGRVAMERRSRKRWSAPMLSSSQMISRSRETHASRSACESLPT